MLRVAKTCFHLWSCIKIRSGSRKRNQASYICSVEHNMAPSTADHLAEKIKIMDPGSKLLLKIKLGRTKATAIVQNVMGKYSFSQVAEKFSLIIDESNDRSRNKNIFFMVWVLKAMSHLILFWLSYNWKNMTLFIVFCACIGFQWKWFYIIRIYLDRTTSFFYSLYGTSCSHSKPFLFKPSSKIEKILNNQFQGRKFCTTQEKEKMLALLEAQLYSKQSIMIFIAYLN